MTSLSIDDNHFRASKAEVSDGKIHVCLEDGREILVPLAYFPELLDFEEKNLKKIEIVERGRGIFFHGLNEAVSVASLFGVTDSGDW